MSWKRREDRARVCKIFARSVWNFFKVRQVQEQEYEQEVELIDYIEVLLKRRTLIVLITLLSAAGIGILSLTQARTYESNALVVVSQPIASARMTGGDDPSGVMPGSEIQVSGLSASTYEALATGDELIAALRDSLLATDLPAEAIEFLRDLKIEEVAQGLLSAELVKETEKAESPLLSFRATSSVQGLPVPLVNRWVELFKERHRGLSANVADDYYQWVQGQYDITKISLERAEDALRVLTTSYSELSVLEAEIDIKTDLVDTSLAEYQKNAAELEAKRRELDFIGQQLRLVELGDQWLGYAELSQLPTSSEMSKAPRPRRDLALLRRQAEQAVADSLDTDERHEALRRADEASRRSKLLAFERNTNIQRSRRRAADLDSTLKVFRSEAAQLDQKIKAVGLDLEVSAKNLALEPQVLRTAKAIVDEELWSRALKSRDIDARLQQELGKYRLVTESLNPTHEQLRAAIRTMHIDYDRATTRIGFLENEIPVLEAGLSGVQGRLDSLVELESTLLHRLDHTQLSLSDSLARDALPLHEHLALMRASLAAQRDKYRQMKQREDLLSREVTGLSALVNFQKGDFESWSEQIRAQGTKADALARQRRGLEREQKVYQTSFDRFASLLEEARIARVQAAGDIQIVSRAVATRVVPRGTVKKAAIAGIVGLMASVMLAFLLEYVARARGNQAAAAE